MRPLALLSVVCVLLLAASPAGAQSSIRLPAAFYDVDVREQLGVPGPGGPSNDGGVSINASRPVGSNRISASGTRFSNSEFGGAYRFIVDVDSLLYRNGPNHIEIPISAILRVEEMGRPIRNQAVWVRVTYRLDGVPEPREFFMRRTGTRDQAQLVMTLRYAMERNAIARREAAPTPPR